MKHIGITMLLAAVLGFTIYTPDYVSVAFIHLLIWSMLLHVVGYGLYLAYCYSKEVAADLEEHTQKVNLRLARQRIEAKLRHSSATNWGRVETWRQYVKLAEAHPEHIKQALKFSAAIEREINEQNSPSN